MAFEVPGVYDMVVLSLGMKYISVTINMVLTFVSVVELQVYKILKCDHSNESY